MCGQCERHGPQMGHNRDCGCNRHQMEDKSGCGCHGHHGYRAMTLEEEVEMLEKVKENLQGQLNSVEARLAKLKA